MSSKKLPATSPFPAFPTSLNFPLLDLGSCCTFLRSVLSDAPQSDGQRAVFSGRQPAPLPSFTDPCFLPPRSQVLICCGGLFFCFDFRRSVSKHQPTARIPLDACAFFSPPRSLDFHMKRPSMQNSHCSFSLVIFRATTSRAVKLRS